MPPHAYAQPPRLANRHPRRRGLISLTPLIDVVFILLVFFMLASSFLERRAIELDAPAGSAAGGVMEGAILVQVRADGIRVSGTPVTLENLGATIAERISRVPDARVVVQPAQGVVLQDAVRVLDRLSVAGVENVSLVRHGG